MILKKLFKALVLISLFQYSSQWELQTNEHICADFLAHKDKDGNHLQILSDGQVPDLQEYSFKGQNVNEVDEEGNNNPDEEIVIQIQNDCKLVVCNATGLEGTCAEVSKNITLTELAETDFTLASAHCKCDKICDCDSIVLRRTECGRAYIDKSCSECDAPYADMRPGNHKSFPGSFRDKITSIILRPGCTLTTYDDTDFQGAPTSFKTKITANTENHIGSYKCNCNTASAASNGGKNLTRPSHYPPMIDVPRTRREINQLLNQRQDRHPGLIAGLHSLKNKRSSRHAYILLLGLTGAGKSSTINFLFDNPTITKAGDANSTTTNIHEYQIPIPVDELGMANSQLRVIDTPGLVDTRGLEQDAKFMSSFEKYFETHEDLRRYVPNVILIFAKFNDNRFFGDGANFVKMLRSIDVFREKIMSKKFSNVIIVLTHYMLETNSITKNPSKRLADFRKVVEEFSQFPKPIIITVAENKPHEESLTMMNGFYRLPNGDYYPRNLFEQIQAATAEADPIGEAIIRTAFKNPDAFVVKQKTFALLDQTSDKFMHYLGILSGTYAPPQLTEVSESLQESYRNMSSELKKEYPDTLEYVQRAMFNRRMLNLNSLPSTTPELAKFFKEIRTNPAILELLDSALSLTPPFFPGDYLTGRSYKLVEDKSEPISPLNLENMSRMSDIGFALPEALTCNLQNSVRTIFNNYNSKEEYLNGRLNELGVDGAMKLENFNGRIKAGRNVVDPKDVTSSSLKLSAVIEYETFQLSLAKKPELSQRFINSVNQLEQVKFDKSNVESIQSWTNFFSNFGSHVVSSAYGGGSLEIRLEYVGNTSSNLVRAREDLMTGMYSIVRFVEDSMIGRTENVSDVLESMPDIKLTLRFLGGDYKYHLTNISHDDASEILENWRDSISLQPVMLENGITILPVSEVVKQFRKDLNSTFYETMEKAASALLNSSLTYNGPPQVRGAAPLRRENTAALPDQAGSSGSMEEFLNMFKTITEASKQAQDRFQDMWEKMLHQQQEREAVIRKETEENRKIEKQERLEAELRLQEQIEREKDRQLQRLLIEQQRHMEENKLRDAERAEERRMERENHLIQQQETNRQQEMLLNFVNAQNEQATALQKAALENRPPSTLSQIGDFVGKTAGAVTGLIGGLFG